MIECRRITRENAEALNLPNEPIVEDGRVIPLYDGRNWSYRVEMFAPEKITETCFPDENYKLEDLGENYLGIAAYVDGECAGFALTKMEWNKWLYLDNLLVLKKFRRAGVGTALIESSMELAKSMGFLGVWLVCQDNNLQAMKFYFRNGFTLGGMNMPVYEGTKQEGKADLYLYRRVK